MNRTNLTPLRRTFNRFSAHVFNERWGRRLWPALLVLSACGGGLPEHTPPAAPVLGTSRAIGSVSEPIRGYAAARFLDQASFGPTPAAISSLKTLGYAAWIDRQLALPVTRIDGTSISSFPDLNVLNKTDAAMAYQFNSREMTRIFLSAEDQLRMRVSWAMSNFIVVSQNKVTPYGATEYFNLLQTHALGQVADLLRAVIKSPAIGDYLDNAQNRKQGACDSCFLNENFARELMQLFTVGVFKLNRDGSMARDAAGKPIESYAQSDVQDMARALSGWSFDDAHVVRPSSALPNANNANRAGYDKPMIATWPGGHDDGAKTIMGVTIPAGQTAVQDVESVVALLLAHPNIGPFISYRLIQALTTSDPSAAYMTRVVSVFENDGSGKRGNLGAVVKAILLDPEARRGDDPAVLDRQFGRMKDPMLQATSSSRAIGCVRALSYPWGSVYGVNNQQPLNAPTVFSFYSPMHRAPGSNVLAPEQKLLDAKELRDRIGGLYQIWGDDGVEFTRAGCNFGEFTAALDKSTDAFIALINERFFRGSMPPMLRDFARLLLKETGSDRSTGQKATLVISFLLTTPSFGVIK